MIAYKQYEILPEAVQEFKEARLYYKLTRVKGLSNRFAKSVKNTIQQVLKNPGAYAIRYNDVRIAYIERFPYAIHFTVEEKSIFITAIIYEKRDISRL